MKTMKTMKTVLPPRIAHWAAVALTFMLACSAASDLFNPTRKPEIKSPAIQSLELDKYELDPGETATATASATDANGQALSYEWTVSGGQLLPPLDRSQVKWKTPVVGGAYRITVTVSNEEKSASRSVSATVRSPVGPVVKILSPSEGSHRMQHTTLSVTAQARHDNGIARVDLFLNGILQATSNGRTDARYDFTCALEEPAGPASVRIEAVANVTGRVGSDSVGIVIDGLIIGKSARR
jgi:hypothetical protein